MTGVQTAPRPGAFSPATFDTRFNVQGWLLGLFDELAAALNG